MTYYNDILNTGPIKCLPIVSLLNMLLNPPLHEYVIPSETGNAKVTMLSKSRTTSRLADHSPAFAPKNVQSNDGELIPIIHRSHAPMRPFLF